MPFNSTDPQESIPPTPRLCTNLSPDHDHPISIPILPPSYFLSTLSLTPPPPSSSSKQPHVRKDEPHGQEEAEPDLPAHARLLGHAQHAGHGAAEPDARVVEGVIHAVGEGGGGADLVTDGDGYLGGRLRRLDLGILVGGGG